MPSLKHNCSDELYARLQQGPGSTFADNPLTHVDSSDVFTFLVLSSGFALRHAATVQNANFTKQCRQILVELLFDSVVCVTVRRKH